MEKRFIWFLECYYKNKLLIYYGSTTSKLENCKTSN